MNDSENRTLLIDTNWGCDYSEILPSPLVEKVRICLVKVSDISKIAIALSKQVLDTSWMMELDNGTQRSYRRTVEETAEELVKIFKETGEASLIGSEFGEVMVSMTSARALHKIFGHQALPIAELWKPQLSQNEGFDFHTVCPRSYINFGEAKFSAGINPYTKAITQAKEFIEKEKHLRDRNHLVNLASGDAIRNLDDDAFGVIAAFSLNSENHSIVLGKAITSLQRIFDLNNVESVYLVGVSH
jgi:hypothetical protein